MSGKIPRRKFVGSSFSLLGSLPLSAHFNSPAAEIPLLKIVCLGGHPDDPETGCGGTLAKFSNAGHRVTIIYLTKGETGIPGKGPDETAAIRSDEALRACKILGAKPVFAGQVNGGSIVNNDWYSRILALLKTEKPDIIFTHWPIDSHKDHLATSILTQKAHLEMGGEIPLYFYEVCTGRQTRNFQPTDYVDITDTQDQKRKAVFCHKSQGFVSDEIYQKDHGMMEDFRGMSISVKAAEAFVKLAGPGSIV
jgi:LmbE family N-acetylglucosaminyl deacetylase